MRVQRAMQALDDDDALTSASKVVEEAVGDGSNDEDVANPGPARRAGRPRGKGKAKAKAEPKRKGKASAVVAPGGKANVKLELDEDGEEKMKKCKGQCRKNLQSSCFNNDQATCKKCINDTKRFDRLCAVQGESEWYKDLKSKQPKAAADVMRKYCKQHEQDPKNMKFSVLEMKQRIVRKMGERRSNRSKWMWKDEYVEEMQTVRMGAYSKSEAVALWEQMDKDKKIKKKKDGPRGHEMMKVKLGDYESSFSELDDEEEVEVRSTPKKAPKAGDLKAAGRDMLSRGGRRPGVFMASDDEGDASASGDDARRQLRRGFNSGQESASVRDYAAEETRTLKRAHAGDGDGDQSDGDGKAAGVEPASGKKKRKKADAAADSDDEGSEEWFDLDAHLPKAARNLNLSIHKIKTELELQVQAADAAVVEFTGDLAAGMFAKESSVLANRLTAVKLVLGKAGQSCEECEGEMKKYLGSFASGSASSSGSTTTNAAGAPAQLLSRAGPCPGFRQLSTLMVLQKHSDDIMHQRSAEVVNLSSLQDLAALIDQYEKPMKAINELAKSLKFSINELFQVIT